MHVVSKCTQVSLVADVPFVSFSELVPLRLMDFLTDQQPHERTFLLAIADESSFLWDIWDIAGAVGNLISCHHPCGTVNPRRAPTPGFGCHTGCPVITQACTCTTYRALPASRQPSIVPVHKGGAPLPRVRGPGCEPGTSRL